MTANFEYEPRPQEDARLSLCWLRETRMGTVHCDLGLPVTPATLGAVLQDRLGNVDSDSVHAIAANILASVPATGAVEVHLPFIPIRRWRRRTQFLRETQFEMRGSRLLPSLLVHDPKERNAYHARLLAAAAFHPCSSVVIEAGNRKMPAGLFAAWRRAPSERTAAYFGPHSSVSVTLQRVLRRMIYEHWTADPTRFAHVSETWRILSYVASAPFRGRPRTDLTYDLLDPTWFRGAFHLAGWPLRTLMTNISRSLRTSGQQDLAVRYNPRLVRMYLKNLTRRPCTARKQFAAENHIINLILKFGAGMCDAKSLHDTWRAMPPFVASLEVGLRRFGCGVQLANAATVILIEATQALAAGLVDEASLLNQQNPVVFAVPDKHPPIPIDKHPVRPCQSGLERIRIEGIAA